MDVYASYALTYYFQMFCPNFMVRHTCGKSSFPFTLAFSNLPGLRKPISVKGSNSIKIASYFIPGGFTGLGICVTSYIDTFKITVTVDDTISKEPRLILDLIEKEVNDLIKNSKDIKI